MEVITSRNHMHRKNKKHYLSRPGMYCMNPLPFDVLGLPLAACVDLASFCVPLGTLWGALGSAFGLPGLSL